MNEIKKPLVNYDGIISELKVSDSFSPIDSIFDTTSLNFQTSPSNSVALSTAAILPNVFYAMPFLARTYQSVVAASIRITTISNTSQVRLGMYTNKSSFEFYPDILVWQSNAFVPNVLGPTNTLPISPPLFHYIKTGLYWLVLICNNTPPIITGFSANSLIPIFGIRSDLTGYNSCMSGPLTFGLLPNLAPSTLSFKNIPPYPLIAIRSTP